MKSKVVVSLLMIIVVSVGDLVNCARILGIFPTKTKSHHVMYASLLKVMAKRGHNVTIASHFPMKPKVDNINDVSLDDIIPTPIFTIEDMQAFSYVDCAKDLMDFSIYCCEGLANHSRILDLLKPGEYDVLIVELFGSDCFLPIGHKLGIPTVGMVSSVALPWVNDMVSQTENTAYIPLYFYPVSESMNFYERVINTVLTVYIKFIYEYRSVRPSQIIAENAFGEIPSLDTLSKNMSLILVNSHFSVNQVRPWVQKVVEVGGLHIPTTIEPLPKDMEEFLNDAEHGVIYFSFGTIVPMDSISKEKFQVIVNVLGSLKQKVLWKLNATNLPELPANIKTGLWFPQLSILCHPNTKVFISHGGLLGIQEAIYCGVPMLGVPMFADQGMNLVGLEARGAAILMEYSDINDDTFYRALHKLINDVSYQENISFLSRLFKDRPQHPMDTAVYWLEYVLRYSGAGHLKSAAAELTWYQYMLLDVILFLIMCVVCLYLILQTGLKKIYKYFVKPKIQKNMSNGRHKKD